MLPGSPHKAFLRMNEVVSQHDRKCSRDGFSQTKKYNLFKIIRIMFSTEMEEKHLLIFIEINM